MKRILLFIFLIAISVHSQAQSITISEAREIDADGAMVLLDQPAVVEGITVGFNFRPGAITWTIFDTIENIGLSVFNVSETLDYEFKEGDHVQISGVLAQFNGLSQIVAESIEVLSEGNDVPEAETIQILDETTESKLVRFDNCELVDPDQWQSSGSFNVDVSNGISTLQIRIDSDTDISGRGAPTGIFSVTGIGGQFDNELPFFHGYQLFPRNSMDIFPYNESGTEYTQLTIDEANNTDAEGVAVYDGQSVELTGQTLGINFRPTGMQFSLIDENNNGIGLFLFEGDLGYNYNEGDIITVQGVISQFNGLTQINPDAISFNSAGTELPSPNIVTDLSEATESSFTRVESLSYVDPAQWLGDGSSFNVDLTNGSNTIVMRIDEDTELSDMPAPLDISAVQGVGGQFDSEAPFLEGYQLLPRYISDLDVMLDAQDLISEHGIRVFPNPATEFVNIMADKKISSIALYNSSGKLILQTLESKCNIAHLRTGQYILKLTIDDNVISLPLFKQ